jgi:APA family basic amino acid/polyamine antiporter
MVAMARAGQFPAMVGRISPVTGTPRIATLLQAGWALVLLWTGSFEAIVLYSGVGLAIASLFTVAAVYVMRVRQPNLPRPFQVPGYPWTPAVYLVASGALIAAMFAEETAVALFSLLSILSGLPVYFLMQLRPKMRRT